MRQSISIFLLVALLLAGCGSPTWEEQYNLGVRYLYEGNYEQAEVAFLSAIEIEPKRTETYMGLADVYVASGEAVKAAEALTGALNVAEDPEALKQKLSDVQFRQGEDHLDQRKYEEAAQDFLASLEHNSEREGAWLGLTDAYMGTGDLAQAVDALQQAEAAVPGASQVLKDRLAELSELKEALDTLMTYLGAGDLDALQGDNVKDMMGVLNKYMNYCYADGKLIMDYTGVGFKMLMESTIYYGDLVDGIPNGQGYSIYVSGPYDQYSGSWQFGKPNGSGSEITISDDRTIYDSGTYVDGLGEGTINRTINYSSGDYAVFVLSVSEGYATDGLTPVERSPGLSNWYWREFRVFVYGFGLSLEE